MQSFLYDRILIYVQTLNLFLNSTSVSIALAQQPTPLRIRQ
jgi:hypothetical protein